MVTARRRPSALVAGSAMSAPVLASSPARNRLRPFVGFFHVSLPPFTLFFGVVHCDLTVGSLPGPGGSLARCIFSSRGRRVGARQFIMQRVKPVERVYSLRPRNRIYGEGKRHATPTELIRLSSSGSVKVRWRAPVGKAARRHPLLPCLRRAPTPSELPSLQNRRLLDIHCTGLADRPNDRVGRAPAAAA